MTTNERKELQELVRKCDEQSKRTAEGRRQLKNAMRRIDRMQAKRWQP